MAKVTLPYDTLSQFSASGDTEVPEQWWQAFNDHQLNILIDSALRSNLPLKTTWQRLLAANARVDQRSSSLWPQLDLRLQSGISRPRPDFVGGENTQLSLGASYEVDLWGRIRYSVHAEQYRRDATHWDYKAVAVSLSAEISLAWFRLIAARQQLQLIQQQIRTNKKTLALIRARFGSGQVRGVDILRQKQLISSSNEQKILLETQIQVLENQLSVMLGNAPGMDFDTLQQELPELPDLPSTGIPLQLVNRRPDVQNAYYQLQAADREVASAISAKYPRLSFSMLAAIRSNDVNNLLQSQAISLSGGLLAPLFYGGRLNAAVDEARAIRKQRINDYCQAVLMAFQDVENALIRERKQLERIAAVEEQIELAQKANQQLKIEYLNGGSEYLDVLTGLNQEQQLQRDLISGHLRLLEIRISLYRALAGGFSTSRENQEG